jgi:hypothetical protein
MKTNIYFAPDNVHKDIITPSLFASAKEVIKKHSLYGNYETYYGGSTIQAKEHEIFENLGHLLSYIEEHRWWKLCTKYPAFEARLELIREEFPEYFI